MFKTTQPKILGAKAIAAVCLIVILGSSSVSHARAVSFNVLESSPIGSWQLREQIDTNHKGKKTGSKMKMSMVGKETRNGEVHYWIEVKMDSFKVRRSGKRKATGKTAIIKTLIPEELFKKDPENALNNLRGFGVETIVQNGDEQPMRMSSSGGLMSNMMSMANVEITHKYTKLGNESVVVPAGKFRTDKINGKGKVSMKVLFKKMNMESDSTVWLSSKVPFGVVKMQATTLTNGKSSEQQAELLDFSLSGAVSEITQEPQDMPSFDNPFGQ